MELSSLSEFLQNFETSRVIAYLQEAKIGELIRNRWFLGGTAGLAVVALIMRWRVLLATLLSVAGFAGLVSYTVQQEAGVQNFSNDTLLVFVGGGIALIFVVIYLLFIRSE